MIADVRIVARWMVLVWRPAPVWLAYILVASVASAGLHVLFPWLWQYAVDEISADSDPPTILRLAGWMAFAGVGHALVYITLQGARSVMNARITAFARGRVLDTLTDADPEALRTWRTGDIVARLHDDAGEKMSWFLCSGVFRAYEAALVAGAAFAAMLLSEPSLAFWLLLPLPLLLLAQSGAQGTLSRRNQEVQAAISAVSEEVATTFGTIRVVQSCGLLPTARTRFRAAAASQRDAEIRTAVVQNGVGMLYQYGWQVSLAALLLFGGLEVLDGRMTIGRYVTFEGLVATMVWPMFDFGTLLSRLPAAAVALRRLEELLTLRPAQRRSEPAADPGSLSLVAASVVGRDGAVLLSELSLTVGPGERVALVGEVGAGKSVVVDLLSGLRSASAGQVRVPAEGALAMVPQDPSLLSSTVAENVLLGRDVDAARLERALRVSQLALDLARLPDGIDTIVGERGVTLSGGQRQRVAIARALVGEPALLLLDDATSALDAEVEAAFWLALEAEFPTLGVLLVTHRAGTLSQIDRILVLDHGCVVQQGGHAELVSVPGAYQRLYGQLRTVSLLAGT